MVINWVYFFLLIMAPLSALIGLPILPRDQYIKLCGIKKNEAGVSLVMDTYC